MRPVTGRTVRAWATSVQPATGALVMSTGILSVGFDDAGRELLSWILVALAGLEWLGLSVLVEVRAVTDWDGLVAAERAPGALTAVAATAVLGSRVSLLGWRPLGWALFGLAAALWALLAPIVYLHHPARTVGARFLLTVATQGLVVLGAPLIGGTRARWPVLVLLGLLALGILLFLDCLRSFDWQQVLVGGGDQWVVGGALAISSLATAYVIPLQVPTGSGHALRVLDLALWAGAIALMVLLAAGEALRPRLHYSVTRWATVFPLGMIAAASVAVGHATGVLVIAVVGHSLLWVAVVVWAAVGIGGVRALGGKRIRRARRRATA